MTTIRADKWVEFDWKLDELGNVTLTAATPTQERIYNHVAEVLARDIDMRIGAALMDLGWTPPPGSRWEKL